MTVQIHKERFTLNPLHSLDSYKISHGKMYPANTEYVYSNFTPRSDRLSGIPEKLSDHMLVWFGLQGTLMDYVALWQEQFFDKPLNEVLEAFRNRTTPFTGDADPDLERFKKLHNLGYLPLHVKSLPEGSKVRMGIPVFTIVNTHPDFGWLTNTTETYFSSESWKLPTVATIANAYRRLLDKYAELTGTPPEFVDWQGHCFADRGMSGMMDAAKTCSGHALSFLGSDSVSSVDWLEHFYGAANTFVSGSVPATEHAVMCLGEMSSEKETIRRLIQDVYPSGVISIVSDTWDFWNVITVTALELKDVILNRTPNDLGLAKVVFRPDSGNPVDIICGWDIQDLTDKCETLEDAGEWASEGAVQKECNEAGHGECGNSELTVIFKYKNKYYEVKVDISWNRYDKQYYYEDGWKTKGIKEIIATPEMKGAVECLWDIFGGTTTTKGFKLLCERVGLIYGDSITLERASAILKRLTEKGFASGNIVFGIGSYTYQYLTRDTFGMAMKATYGIVEGVEREIFKDPVTDVGKTKKSAKGLLRVELEETGYVLYDQQTPDQEHQGELKTVFLDGNQYNLQDLVQVRERLRNWDKVKPI